MTSEVVRAVKKATMLIPADSWATPLPAASAEVDVAAAALLVFDDASAADDALEIADVTATEALRAVDDDILPVRSLAQKKKEG